LELQQNLGPGTVTTVYTYDAANQLTSAQQGSTSWQYTYDANGSLISDGVKTYTYDSANWLVEVSDQLSVTSLHYNGLGQRLSMDAAGVIAHYVMDGDRPLTAETGGNTTFYLYGLGAIGEKTTAWNFSLPDGTNTPRQLSDLSGEITLSSRYTPWGDTLDTYGTGNFSYGYLGGVLDAATGLLYVGNGQYYDPVTGRFLTRDVYPNSPNPYVPWNPIGAILGPLGLIVLVFGRKRKGSKTGTFLVLVLVVGSVGMTLAGCGPGNPPSPTPPLPPPVVIIVTNTSPAPTSTPQGKTAYLTFDDGPDPYANTVEIAVALASMGAKATFFVSGANSDGTVKIDYTCTVPGVGGVNYNDPRFNNVNPKDYQLKVVHDYGHAIGLHSWNHVGWSVQNAQVDLDQQVVALNQMGINFKRILRAPYGDFGSKIPVPGYEGWHYYYWTVDSCDNYGGAASPCRYSSPQNAEQVVENVIGQLEAQGYPDRPIILLHTTPNIHTWNAIVNPTPEGNLIEALRSKGYTIFKPLPRDNPQDPVDTIIRQ
jgi:RHS repeat-associated protein